MSAKISKTKQLPITEGLFTFSDGEAHLISGHCKTCGAYSFPKSFEVHRPGCRQPEMEEVLLSQKGKLLSYAWQYYPLPAPFRMDNPSASFGVGLVEFPEGLRVFGIMTGCELKDLKMGMPVRLVAEKLYTDEECVERLTWKFRPI